MQIEFGNWFDTKQIAFYPTGSYLIKILRTQIVWLQGQKKFRGWLRAYKK